MRFAVYLPPMVEEVSSVRCPVMYWLSGLTCTEQNFITKAGSQQACSGYLGLDRSSWEAYDATVLAAYSGPTLNILIHPGSDDQFLSANQLLPDNLIAACSERLSVVYRMQPGYDHSYFFVYSFINDHIRHHAKYLNA